MTQSLKTQLRAIRRELGYLAQAWQHVGAKGIALMVDENVLMRFPKQLDVEHAMLKAPLRVGDKILLLCAVGLGDVRHQPRLFTDANILQRVITQERELDNLTEEIVSNQDQMLMFYELSHLLQDKLALSDVTRIILEKAQHILGVEQTFFISITDDDELTLIISNTYHHIDHAYYKDWLQLLCETESYLKLDETADFENLLLLPLSLQGVEVAGLGFIDHPQGFSMPMIKLANAIAEQATAFIQNSIMYQAQIERAQLQTEMQLARDVQLQLLPPAPQMPMLDVWAISHPAREVGGDFYDFIQQGDTLNFTVGDVSGKGMSAALLMAMTRIALRVLSDETPADILAQLNSQLYDDLTRVSAFVTLITATYNCDTHCLTYANAGHSPVIYCRHDGHVQMLESDSPPVGVLPMSTAELHQIQMQMGDSFIITSDGIPEATNALGEMLGYDAMLTLIEHHNRESAAFIGQALLDAAKAYEGENILSDDSTILIIKRVQ